MVSVSAVWGTYTSSKKIEFLTRKYFLNRTAHFRCIAQNQTVEERECIVQTRRNDGTVKAVQQGVV